LCFCESGISVPKVDCRVDNTNRFTAAYDNSRNYLQKVGELVVPGVRLPAS